MSNKKVKAPVILIRLSDFYAPAGTDWFAYRGAIDRGIWPVVTLSDHLLLKETYSEYGLYNNDWDFDG